MPIKRKTDTRMRVEDLAKLPKKHIAASLLGLFLTSCGGDTTTIGLNAQFSSTDRPDLILLIRMDDPSGGEDPNAVLSFIPQVNPSSFPGTYQATDFELFLRGCALEQGDLNTDAFGSSFSSPSDPCDNLGAYFGDELFQGKAVEIDGEAQAADIKLEGDSTFVFVLFFYGASNLSDTERCVQLFSAEVLGEAFRFKQGSNFVTATNLNFTVPSKQTGVSANCYLLASS